jgi:hypothetical protein
MYPAFRWSVVLPAIMDISAPAISLAARQERCRTIPSGDIGLFDEWVPGHRIVLQYIGAKVA